MPQSNNIRIAKNTIYLYGRTIVVLFMSLYTSRLVFQALGVTDLGIYNVVAGIVTLMTFLLSAQTQSTSRFITFELGRQNEPSSQHRIFSICVTIHVLIALFAVLFSETIGLWAVNDLTAIPSERMTSARIVYQFAIATLVVRTIRVPLEAVVIAHEKMSIYAIMSVVEAVLNLCSAIILTNSHGDRLVLYGLLVLIVSILVFFAYIIYVRKRFNQYRFRWLWDKNTSVQVLSFSGWTLLGSGADTASQQGVALLMNNFVGLVANTALGFSQQVNSAVKKFVTSFSTAFNPQVIKLYAEKDWYSMHKLIRRASKFSFVLCYVLALPLIANMPFILKLWLGDVPEYTSAFCCLILVCSIFDSATGVFYTAISATGKIKWFQTGISISFIIDFACAYLLLVLNIHPSLVFGSRILTRGLLNMGIELFFMRKLLDFDIKSYFIRVLVPIFGIVILTVPAVMVLSDIYSGWPQLIITSIACVILTAGCSYFIILDKTEKRAINNFVLSKIHQKPENGKNLHHE